MSAFPTGKKYMAVVYSNKSSVPSDNPADYAGHWALIQGADGADGVPGTKGADGRTSYFHTAWANDVSGQSGFTVSGGDGKSTLARTATSHKLIAPIRLITIGHFSKVKTVMWGRRVKTDCQGNRVLMVVLLMPTLLMQTAKTARPTFQLLTLTASILASTATSHLTIAPIK